MLPPEAAAMLDNAKLGGGGKGLGGPSVQGEKDTCGRVHRHAARKARTRRPEMLGDAHGQRSVSRRSPEACMQSSLHTQRGIGRP